MLLSVKSVDVNLHMKSGYRHVGVYGFEHITYVDCPWCEETVWLNRLKLFKKN